jgi:hypothetical protein
MVGGEESGEEETGQLDVVFIDDGWERIILVGLPLPTDTILLRLAIKASPLFGRRRRRKAIWKQSSRRIGEDQ